MIHLKHSFIRWIGVGLALMFALQSPTLAQDSSPEPIQAPETTTVVLDGKPLFNIKTDSGSFSATDRASAIRKRLVRIANDPEIPVASIRTEPRSEDVLIVAGEAETLRIAAISARDAAAENTQPQALADRYTRTIQEALKDYRQARSVQKILIGIFYTLLATVVLILVFNLLNFVYAATVARLKQWFSDQSFHVRLARARVISVMPLIELALRFVELTRNILNLIIIGFYVFLVFSFFPWTKPLSRKFWGLVSSTLLQVEQAIIGYLPNLFILIFIIFITREILAFTRLYFREVESGNITVSWLYSDWVKPTFQVVRFFVLALSIAIALPYLPGFRSPAFQGVSLVVSALLTLGAAGAVSNIVGGVIAVYTRGFQLGDMIKIGDLMGIVTEKTLLVTRIRTPKNVIITIPNATVLNSNIINYSALAKDDSAGLILHTTITLGYDVSWAKVHETLIQAAKLTPHILHNPPPFVLQSSLNDYNVAYELNAHTDHADHMPQIYSALHQNIQDKCNEAGIEILSPGYFAVRDGNHSTIPGSYLSQDYTAPGFRVDPESTKQSLS
jgi:small-conductance mechanosensitive channel